MPTKKELLQAENDAFAAFALELKKYDGEDATPPTAGQIGELNKLKAASLTATDALTAFAEVESMRASVEARQELAHQPANRPPLARGDSPQAQRDVRSLGQRFLDSPDTKAWQAASGLGNGGFISDSRRIGDSPPLAVGSFFNPNAALITGQSSTSGGAFITNDVYPGLVPLGRRELTVRDIITNGTTDSDVVEFVRVTAETNAAAPVAEATAASGASGVKPESNLTFERVSTPVKVIAHWIPATKMALADAGQLRTLIDEFLRYGLEEELEDQIVNGDGVGQSFTGIFNTTGTQTQAWDTNILTTTRKAKTLVSTVGREVATAYVLSPTSWETIDLLQDNEARYYAGGPFTTMTPRLWGLPVVISEALPTGFALVGNFRRAVLWDRQQATISVSDSHSDFFIRNLVAILAEMRAAFGVLKPSAFVEIDVVA